ncbi:MAG: DMT family transporter [Alphaproteobacteria bacterium]|nr:DMT family transporter [Alphaproteobacteria bacterium]
MHEHEKRDYLLKGVLPVLCASILWAFGYFARKIILFEITPLTLTFITAFVVSMSLMLWLRPHPLHLWRVFHAHIWNHIALAFTGVIFGTTLMFIALDNLDLGLATVLEKLQPLFTLVLAALFLKERLPVRVLPYCLAALISSVFIFTESTQTLQMALSPQNLIGVGAVIGAAFSWGMATIIGRKLMLSGVRSREVTLIRFTLAWLFLAPILLLQGDLVTHFTLSPFVWIIAVGSAIITTAGGYVLFYSGIKVVDAPTSGFLELLTPIVSLALGLIFLDETIRYTQIFFIGLMLFSIYKISTTKTKRT